MKKEIYHRTFARIDLSAIEENFDRLKARLSPETLCMAVVKANAYGHGAVAVSRRLEKKADFFAVATFEEALELREAGIEKPILILSYTDPSRYLRILRHNITPTFCSLEEAKAFSLVAERGGFKGKFHVAVDTGMSRIGVPANENGAEIIEKAAKLPYVRLEGVFSHFATADETDKTFALEQKKRFDSLLTLLEEKEILVPIKHISNSAASIEMDASYDLCRFGISLYGYYPSDEVDKNAVSLTPAMTVKTHVIAVKEVDKGTGISYGQTYIAPEKKSVATLSIGYADGFNRCISNVGYVLIHGKKAPVLGKVCMDMIMVDVTEISDVKVGDEVTILGKDGEEVLDADAFGAMCHSFSYEVLCNFSSRVTHIFDEEE